jgi:hypothetical protein
MRSCISGDPPLIAALLPQTNLGLTTSAYPEFFWFMPKTRARLAEFALYAVDNQKANRSLLYKTTFRITGNSGIASLPLPSDATLPPLAIAQDYHWSVSIICDPNDRKQDLTVDGWVQRVALRPALANQLNQATPSERVNLYARNGLWFDTLKTLAELRRSRPQDSQLQASWVELLKSVKLEAIANQPLVQPTSSESNP